jgi:hypothetical protein
VDKRIRHGRLYHLAYISASTALPTIATLEFTSHLCDLQILTVRLPATAPSQNLLTRNSEWQWDQLRIMKVGGNESATKFFQSNGGTAALNSKDPKTKYTSNAATKYREELKRRATKDELECVAMLSRRSCHYRCYGEYFYRWNLYTCWRA